MRRRMFGDERGSQGPGGRLPDGVCVYAIGDIHGRSDLLREIHDAILSDASARDDRRKKIVYVGDYVDRGVDSRGVIDLLLGGGLEGFERVFLKGNHEDFLLTFLKDADAGPVWMLNGGAATLASYGVDLPARLLLNEDGFAEIQQDFARELPPEHLAFLERLELYHIEGDYLFVHAGIRPNVPLDKQDPHDLLWIREEFLASAVDHGRVIVHGHTPMSQAQDAGNRIGIDTGAFATGVLTCLVLQGKSRTLLQT